MKLNVLIIGFGKMGQLKSCLYKKRSCNVFVVDNDKNQEKVARNYGVMYQYILDAGRGEKLLGVEYGVKLEMN